MEQNQPNILLIMTDQMRGDCMGISGHPDVKTPYLDSLATSGILFPNAYSACPSCIAARAALHTGLSQAHNGRVGYQDGVDWNYKTTLAGEFAKNGYYTQCVGKMHVHPLRSLMGFHNIELHDGNLGYYRRSTMPFDQNQKNADDYFHWLKNEKGIDCDVSDTGIDCNSWIARPWPYDEASHPTNWVTTHAIDFLRRRDQRKPFFLMASYLRPHPPFDAPQCFFDMYKDVHEPPIGDWVNDEALLKDGRIFDSSTGPIDKELVKQAQIGYYACITHLDHQIGRLLLALHENGIYNNTVIMFTSDHGEMLCDHKLYRKALPYQGSIRVPMLISGGYINKSHEVCDSIVELRDVMPTLLSCANLPIPENIDGKIITKSTREYLHGEHAYGNASNHFIVTKKDKYIWFSQTGREQYFDLVNDKTEMHDLIQNEKCKSRIDELRQNLINELTSREEGFVKDGKLLIKCEQRATLKNATRE